MKLIYIGLISLLLLSGCEKKEKEHKQNEQAGEIKVTQGVVKKQQREEKELDKGTFYYSYKEANKQKSNLNEDGSDYTQLGALRHIRSPYEKVQISLLANKLSKDFLIYCSACHDDYANGVIGPSLLGKDGEYIYKQLIKFKSGDRKNVLMKQLVNRLSEDKLRALSDEIAEFNKKIQKLREENSIKDEK